jgi:serine phosphatase RsbU (regulator of sigma subunit)
MHTGTLATAAVARLEPVGPGGGCVLRWANAGHPPPGLLHPDGAASLLLGERFDLMLGVDPDADRRESVVVVEPGATVVLYTDGLVESRGRSLDEGFELLRGHLTALAGQPLDVLCDELLDRMVRGVPQDDVALVALRLSGPPDCARRRPSGD